MKILLHICCAPCAVYTVEKLRNEGHDIAGFFYNPNIHPYTEYKRRFATLEAFAEREKLQIIASSEYNIEEFLRNVVFRETNRCEYCYYDRLKQTAFTALREHFESFTTTILYSLYQKHNLVKDIGEHVGKEVGVPFYYYDFRVGWKEGIRKSKDMGLYRQPYCGCIYSEKERFFRPRS